MSRIIKSFTSSIRLPRKKSVFYLNRIGMDVTVIYLFLLLFIASIPALIDQSINRDSLSSEINLFFFLIYFFIFYYLIINLIVFSLISILAYIWSLIARLLKRKLRFAIMWKMIAYCMTMPILVFTLISFKFSLSSLFLIISFVYVFFIMFNIILIYPKRKHFNKWGYFK